MNANKFFTSAVFLGLLLILSSCEQDDRGVVRVELNDRTEQQAADKDSLQLYFSTHYYNASTFQSGQDYTVEDIIISELPKDENGDYLPLPNPTENKLLSEEGVLEVYTENYLDIEYEFYILRINSGGGVSSPKFTDKVRVTYEGSFVDDGEVFDGAVSPVDFNLTGGISTGGVITGWQRVFPKFNEAENYVLNGDGTVDYDNYGLGVMFLPSGLAYYGGTASIPPYSNLIFKFSLLQTEENDHDNDGIPSYIEDLDGNIDVFNDDTDEDFLSNYLDTDDDGDGVLTINELFPNTYVVDTTMGETEPVLAENEYERSRTEADGIITINTVTLIDSDNNGTPDYLDEEITINYNDDSDS